jgi:hypothetical protein
LWEEVHAETQKRRERRGKIEEKMKKAPVLNTRAISAHCKKNGRLFITMIYVIVTGINMSKRAA